MAGIKVDVERLMDNSRALERKIQALIQTNQSLNALLSRIGASWEGDASSAYLRMMQRYAQQAENMVDVLTEFKSYVDRAAAELEEADRESAMRLREAF